MKNDNVTDAALETADAATAEIAMPAKTQTQSWWNNPGMWIGLGAGVAVLTLTLLMFIGLYLARQKTGELAHRLNVMEAEIATANGLDSRVTALERQTRQPANAAPADPAEMQKREAEIGSQTAEIATLSQKVEDLQLSSGNRDAMTQTLSGLQQTVASLQTSLQSLSQSFETTKGKVSEIDAALTEKKQENARQFAVLLGLEQLRAAASTSQPYTAELGFARTLASEDPDIMKQLDLLAPYAAEGAPTLNELRVEFADKASEIVRSNVVGDGKSSFRQALYRLGSVVSVRKIGNVTTHNPTETAVAQAESKLEEDDLPGAIQAMSNLGGLPEDVASSWLDSARHRAAVDEALSNLSELSIRRLTAFETMPEHKP